LSPKFLVMAWAEASEHLRLQTNGGYGLGGLKTLLADHPGNPNIPLCRIGCSSTSRAPATAPSGEIRERPMQRYNLFPPAFSWVPSAQRHTIGRGENTPASAVYVQTTQQSVWGHQNHHNTGLHSHLILLHNRSHLLLCSQQNLGWYSSPHLPPLSPTFLSSL